MTQEKQQTRPGMLESRHWKLVLIMIAALLTFGAPYVVYLSVHALNMDWFISIGSGGIVFVIGLALMWYLIKNKVIS